MATEFLLEKEITNKLNIAFQLLHNAEQNRAKAESDWKAVYFETLATVGASPKKEYIFTEKEDGLYLVEHEKKETSKLELVKD